MKKYKLKKSNSERYSDAWEVNVSHFIKINKESNIIFYKDNMVAIETSHGLIGLKHETMDKIIAAYLANKISGQPINE